MRRLSYAPLVTFASLLFPAAPGDTPPAEASALTRPQEEVRDLSKYFHGLKGAFVLYDRNAQTYIRHNVEQCRTRYSPASTYKILNSLIGLETGIIPDEQYVIKWDSVQRDVPAWNQDHTLRSAMKNSVVWYYQELARRVGYENMKKYVDSVQYGNMDISGGIDRFWLESTLTISADEQILFLSKLYNTTLPFSRRSIGIVKDIIELDHTDAYTLRGKTGFASDSEEFAVGWFVGYVEQAGNVYFFATNIISSNPKRDTETVLAGRKKFTRDILKGMGLL